MESLVYKPAIDLETTELAIEELKSFFARELREKLELRKVSAPIAVFSGTGINDDLNGVEEPVHFGIKSLGYKKAEVVQSLAKWKRIRLKELGIEEGKGILTNMSALRPDEELSPIHSIYVDQWDWEKRISGKERSIKYLKATVEKIYDAIKAAEYRVEELLPEIEPFLPEKITFIHSEELAKEFPGLTPKQREDKAAELFGAVFIIGIGAELSEGIPHDKRAPDYDDWTTLNEEGFLGLNGDIIVWNPILKKAFELSSMGVRVDSTALYKQLSIAKCLDRLNLFYHRQVITENIPLSIGGGIGQSRLCMFLLRKSHIGEVQASIWPDEIRESMIKEGIQLM
jgi:aspartate--ammonia ligase